MTGSSPGRMNTVTATRRRSAPAGPGTRGGIPLLRERLDVFQLEDHAVHSITGQLRHVRRGCLALR
jgi:hypothetical protein